MTVMGTDSLGLWQLVAHDLAWQCWVQRLAAGLLALVAGNRGRLLWLGLRRRRLVCRCEGLGLVEKQVLLIGTAGLTLRRKQLALQSTEPFQGQVPLGGGHPQCTSKLVTLSNECGEFFGSDGGNRGHGSLDWHVPSLFLHATLA